MMRTLTPAANRFAMAIEIECSLRYQLEMSSLTVSWLMYCTRMLVTFVFDEKYTWSAAADGRATSAAHATTARRMDGRAARRRRGIRRRVESGRSDMMSGPWNGKRARKAHAFGRRQFEQFIDAVDG